MTAANELGIQVVFDGACPRTITGKARENISGGCFVVCSGTAVTTGVITSGATSFVASDIEFALCTTSFGSGVEQINGISLAPIASGAYGTIATRGAYIVKAGGSVLEGTLVEALSATCVQTLGSKAVPTNPQAGVGNVSCKIPGATTIGRALTGATSGTNIYTLVYFNF